MSEAEFLDALVENPGQTKALVNRNPSGTLWESLWQYQSGQYWHIAAAPGVFVNWTPHDRQQALKMVRMDMDIIKRTHAEWT